MQVATTKVRNNIFSGLEYHINGYDVIARENNLEWTENGVAGGDYSLSTWYNGNLTQSLTFETIEELAVAMKEESGDLRVWKTIKY